MGVGHYSVLIFLFLQVLNKALLCAVKLKSLTIDETDILGLTLPYPQLFPFDAELLTALFPLRL